MHIYLYNSISANIYNYKSFLSIANSIGQGEIVNCIIEGHLDGAPGRGRRRVAGRLGGERMMKKEAQDRKKSKDLPIFTTLNINKEFIFLFQMRKVMRNNIIMKRSIKFVDDNTIQFFVIYLNVCKVVTVAINLITEKLFTAGHHRRKDSGRRKCVCLKGKKTEDMME